MINAGAITVASLLLGNSSAEKVEALLVFIKKMIGRIFHTKKTTSIPSRDKILDTYYPAKG